MQSILLLLFLGKTYSHLFFLGENKPAKDSRFLDTPGCHTEAFWNGAMNPTVFSVHLFSPQSSMHMPQNIFFFFTVSFSILNRAIPYMDGLTPFLGKKQFPGLGKSRGILGAGKLGPPIVGASPSIVGKGQKDSKNTVSTTVPLSPPGTSGMKGTFVHEARAAPVPLPLQLQCSISDDKRLKQVCMASVFYPLKTRKGVELVF